MSTLVVRLPVAGPLAQGDYLVLNQGIPATTRRATVAKVLAASTTSSGQVAPIVLPPRGALHISELAIASTVYLNDTLLVDQGTPPISRLATVAQLLAASGAGSANTELAGTPADKPLSSLPLASAVALDDWLVINQTGPTTRRIRVSNLGIVPPSIFTEDFEAGLSLYTLLVGNFGDFVLAASPWGTQCLKHIQNTTTGVLQRMPTPFTFKGMDIKFKILSEGSPVSTGSSSVMFFNQLGLGVNVFPRGSNPNPGPSINVGAGSVYLQAPALTLDTWYKVSLQIVAGAGNSTASLYSMASGSPVLINTVVVSAGVVLPIVVADLTFTHPVGAQFATEFDDIICYA